MTCQELHCYLENPLRTEIYMYRESLPPAVVEHLGVCAECARLFEEQKALGISLNMARDAAPSFPQALDATVLANYRRQMARPKPSPRERMWSFSNAWLRWAAVATAVIVVLASAMVLSRGHSPTTAKTTAPVGTKIPATVQPQGPAISAKQQSPMPNPNQEASAEQVRRTPAHTMSGPLPPGFASLMYCDELACSGAMEVIRVELPPAPQTQNQAASPVMAEVLVGADGIARGIRIVQ